MATTAPNSRAARPTRAARPGFRAGLTYVVVRPIRISARETLQPGHVIEPGALRRHHMRALNRRRRIGPQGHPYTEYMLSTWESPEERDARIEADRVAAEEAAEEAAERRAAVAAKIEETLAMRAEEPEELQVQLLAEALGVDVEELEIRLGDREDWQAVIESIIEERSED